VKQLRNRTVGAGDLYSLIVPLHCTEVLLRTPQSQFLIEGTHHEVVANLMSASCTGPVLEDLILLNKFECLLVCGSLKLNDCDYALFECLDEPSSVAGTAIHSLSVLSV
jgi:hypothetical protein